jgi:DNA-binding protein HU-beta
VLDTGRAALFQDRQHKIFEREVLTLPTDTTAASNTLTIAALVDLLAERAEIPKARARAVLDTLANIVQAQLAEGVTVVLPGLGRLVPENKPERQGRNPATGESIAIAAKTVARFKPAADLRAAINNA